MKVDICPGNKWKPFTTVSGIGALSYDEKVAFGKIIKVDFSNTDIQVCEDRINLTTNLAVRHQNMVSRPAKPGDRASHALSQGAVQILNVNETRISATLRIRRSNLP